MTRCYSSKQRRIMHQYHRSCDIKDQTVAAKVMGQRGLPSEKELVQLLDTFLWKDAYDENLDIGTGIQEQVTRHIAEEKAKLELKEKVSSDNDVVPDDYDDDDDDTDPKDPDKIFIPVLADICVHTQFKNLQLVPQIVPYKADEDEESTSHKEEDWSNSHCEGAVFEAALRGTHSDFREICHGTYNMGKKISMWTYHMEQFLDKVRTKENKILVTELDKKGYIHTFNEADLMREIKSRQRQCPNQDVYVLMGKELLKYYKYVYKKDKLGGAQIVLDGTSRCYSNRAEIHQYGLLADYESAVVAQNQVRSNASLHSGYKYERVPRAWHAGHSHYMKFIIEVDKRVPPATSSQMSMF